MGSQGWMSPLTSRHYNKAPIREAIIDIRTEGSPSLAPTNFSKVTPPSGYKERQELMLGQVSGHLAAGQLTATAKQDPLGYAFVGGEGKHIAEFRVNGFTFHRLAPYQTWEQFRTEAKLLWDLYREVASQPINRFGLRYVNQLDLPMPIRDFRDFVRSYPEISTDLTQQLSGFFMQVHIPQQDLGAMLILNESLVPPSSPDIVSVILDIDVFVQVLKPESDEDVWNTLELLRVRKNLIFEACITNNTRELIS